MNAIKAVLVAQLLIAICLGYFAKGNMSAYLYFQNHLDSMAAALQELTDSGQFIESSSLHDMTYEKMLDGYIATNRKLGETFSIAFFASVALGILAAVGLYVLGRHQKENNRIPTQECRRATGVDA